MGHHIKGIPTKFNRSDLTSVLGLVGFLGFLQVLISVNASKSGRSLSPFDFVLAWDGLAGLEQVQGDGAAGDAHEVPAVIPELSGPDDGLAGNRDDDGSCGIGIGFDKGELGFGRTQDAAGAHHVLRRPEVSPSRGFERCFDIAVVTTPGDDVDVSRLIRLDPRHTAFFEAAGYQRTEGGGYGDMQKELDLSR